MYMYLIKCIYKLLNQFVMHFKFNLDPSNKLYIG